MNTIAILYICTGNYIIFWKDFYLSVEKYLLPNYEKHYFVFTDSNPSMDNYLIQDRVHIFEQNKLGWPYDTLMRFNMFSNIKNFLIKFDYIYFFNSNMLLLEPVGEEFLPIDGSGLVATLHPYFYSESKYFYPYDRNKKSLAYIPFGKGKYYFMGGLNGGRSNEYLYLIDSLKSNIQLDLDLGVIAKWHDESHLNRYLVDKDVKILGPEYGYPEDSYLPFKAKFLIRDKNKWGGHNYLRNNEINLVTNNENDNSYKKREDLNVIKSIIYISAKKIKHIVKTILGKVKNSTGWNV